MPLRETPITKRQRLIIISLLFGPCFAWASVVDCTAWGRALHEALRGPVVLFLLVLGCGAALYYIERFLNRPERDLMQARQKAALDRLEEMQRMRKGTIDITPKESSNEPQKV